jgi:hypothetical protein
MMILCLPRCSETQTHWFVYPDSFIIISLLCSFLLVYFTIWQASEHGLPLGERSMAFLNCPEASLKSEYVLSQIKAKITRKLKFSNYPWKLALITSNAPVSSVEINEIFFVFISFTFREFDVNLMSVGIQHSTNKKFGLIGFI